MRKYIFFVLLILVLINPITAQTKDELLSIKITPGFSMPLGHNGEIFNYGMGTDISIQLPLAFLPVIYLDATSGYSAYSIIKENLASIFNFGGGLGMGFDIVKRFYLGCFVRGGYYHSFIHDTDCEGGFAYLITGAVFAYKILPGFSLGLNVAYRDYFGFLNEIVISLETVLYILNR